MGDNLETIDGIVLKQMDYKESSKIIYLYTAKGKISVLVHGSNKPKSPYLNLVRVFSHVRLMVSGKSLKTLRDGEVLSYFSEISEDLDKYSYGMHLLEVIYYFSEHDHDHEKLYAFLLKILVKMVETEDVAIYVMMAELKLLYLLGVQPFFKHCVHCNSEKGLRFSVKDGGMVCEKHESYSKYNASTIQLMMQLYYYDLQKPSELIYDKQGKIELRQLIDEYYAFHLNYQSRSRKMLRDMLGY